MTMVFLQEAIVCEKGGFQAVGVIVNYVGGDPMPDHLLPCNGSAHKRRLHNPYFVQQMRPFTSWWRWHALRQFRTPVRPTWVGVDVQGETWASVVETDPAEDLKRFQQVVASGRYYDEPHSEQQDDLGRTLMIPRRDPRYDVHKPEASRTLSMWRAYWALWKKRNQ